MTAKGIKIIKFSQASSLAKVISNKTAQQIIEYIGSNNKNTASQISKSLHLPASTVHYNMKALVKGGIVDDSQFTYSTKGKTIIHYMLTNNILVIVPETQDSYSIMNSIKSIKSLVPAIIGVGLIGLASALFSKTKTIMSNSLSKTGTMGVTRTKYAMPEAVLDESALLEKSEPIISQTISSSPHEFLWGLAIATIIITIIFLITNYVRSRKKKR